MPYFETGGKLIFFAHVPKTGGSSVEDYLAARFGQLAFLDREWETHWVKGGYCSDSLRSSPQHITAADAERLLPRHPDWSFAVVREPIARLVSEYRFQSKASQRWRRRLTRLGFSIWLRLVLAAARHELTIFDNHLRPQSDLVPKEAEHFRLEDGFRRFIDRLNVVTSDEMSELEMGHALRSDVTKTIAPTPEDIYIIYNFYAEDYKRFCYEIPKFSNRQGIINFSVSALASVAGVSLAKLYRSGRF